MSVEVDWIDKIEGPEDYEEAQLRLDEIGQEAEHLNDELDALDDEKRHLDRIISEYEENEATSA